MGIDSFGVGDTVGRNKKAIEEYIRNQLKEERIRATKHERMD